LRDLGATMTRSHYPLHPLALELADRYGIVVWSEVPVYQMRDALFRRSAVRQGALDMIVAGRPVARKAVARKAVAGRPVAGKPEGEPLALAGGGQARADKPRPAGARPVTTAPA